MIAAETEPAPAPSPPDGLAPASVWDEVRTPSGEVRPHWRPLLQTLESLGREELGLRIENGRRILREHGVSCFVMRGDAGQDVPWDLDFLPLILPAEEWRTLAEGLVQRARLLNLVLGDLYGVQRLVRDGFVPAPLVFANPGFLRACQAVRVPEGRYLQMYAADLGRGPDGTWRVLADRTQAPAGFGFALENRSVISRVLPEAIQALQPRPLSESLRRRRDALCRCAPADVANPNIALLTPGPRNEAYFEHAYLARLLGFTLVEGGDLTVRDRRVFLKTLEGLRPVDVILRRVSDAFCDPLALRGDSLLGVPGLVEATRARRLVVTNALGSGLVESPAFLPFLPGIAPHLLGEELKLPAISTWWCGQVRERRRVEDGLDELFLRPAFAVSGPRSRPGALADSARAEWRARLREAPHEFVAQEELRLSEVAKAAGGATPFILRCFVVHDGSEFHAMTGGLVRLVDQSAWGTQDLPLSGGSKDVWVLPEQGVDEGLPHVIASPPPFRERLASDLPSRVAENLFWLGRYTERLEHLVRVCRATAGHLMDNGSSPRVPALAELLAEAEFLSRPGPAVDPTAHLQTELLALIHGEQRERGVGDLLNRIHTASFSIRDRLSADTWRILTSMGNEVGNRPAHLPLVFARSTLNALVFDLAAFSGMMMENTTRGHGWMFLDLGRRIERGVGMVHLLEAARRCHSSPDLLLEPLLEIADSVMTYRRRYFVEPHAAGVFDLLLLDPANPRALAFQLVQLDAHAAALPSEPNPEGVAEVRQRLGHLAARLDGWRAEQLVAPESAAETDDWLAALARELGSLSDFLTSVYFSQVRPRLS